MLGVVRLFLSIPFLTLLALFAYLTFPAMSPITLYLNKNTDKTVFDHIVIYKKDSEDNGFTVYYKPDVTRETKKYTTPIIVCMKTHHDVLDYLEDVMDMLYYDADSTPYTSIDLLIPAYPVVGLKPNMTCIKDLVLRVVRGWAKRA